MNNVMLVVWFALTGLFSSADGGTANTVVHLERYDMPGKAVERKAGADVVDWPKITINGKVAFVHGSTEMIASSTQPAVIQPGGLKITKDPVKQHLTLFPVLIRTGLPNTLRNVTLRTGGTVVYENRGPIKTLTLLLPQNESDKPYELMVNGKGPALFSVGVLPSSHGHQLIPVNTMVAATRPRVIVTYAESMAMIHAK